MEWLDELWAYDEWKEDLAEIEWVRDSVSDIVTLEFKALQNREFFENLYNQNIKSGNWKPRTPKEKESISQNYKILRNWQNIVAWLALKEYQLWEQKGNLIECLWGSPDYDWAGSQIVQKAFELIPEWESLFAYSAQWWFFEKCWFEKVLWETSSTGNSLYQRKK